ncbi:TPA: terminase small subunit, partial [Escherichia coli]
REVEELRQASEADLQPGTIEYERHRLTRAQADAQELKNARDSAEVVETAFCTFVLSRIAGEIASILDGLPLSVQRRFPELENRHVDFLKPPQRGTGIRRKSACWFRYSVMVAG